MDKVESFSGFNYVAYRNRIRFRYQFGRRKKAGFNLRGQSETKEAPLCECAARIRALTLDERVGGAAFQSVSVVVLTVLEDIREREMDVLNTAASLGQRIRLEEMTATLDSAIEALAELLSGPGRMMHDMQTDAGTDEPKETLWWYAVSDAMQSLENGLKRVAATVACQPKGGPSRTLGGIVNQLLHTHYNVLLREAQDWMG